MYRDILFIFLILLCNMHCGYLLEPCIPAISIEQNKKLKIVIFTAVKNHRILFMYVNVL